jgi:hypothetical protein
METLKVFGFVFILAAAYLITAEDDYHKKFDKEVFVRYNCNVEWNDKVPQEVIDKCKVSEKNYVYIKTYQE